MDYNILETFWSSNNINNLVKFYEFINSPEKAYNFSIQREKSRIKIYHHKSSSNICFIIPTISINNFLMDPYWNFVSKFDAIIVESSGQYFNYARSINCGITEALNYNYKTLILSNDDMEVVDNKNKLLKEIENLEDFDVILPTKIRKMDSTFSISDKFSIVNFNLTTRYMKYINWIINKNDNFNEFKSILNLINGYKYTVFEGSGNKKLDSFILRFLKVRYKNICLFNSFGIFKRDVLENQKMDEAFINGKEDYEFVIRLINNKFSFVKSSFRISDIGGKSLNIYNNNLRKLKDLLSELILNYYIVNNFNVK